MDRQAGAYADLLLRALVPMEKPLSTAHEGGTQRSAALGKPELEQEEGRLRGGLWGRFICFINILMPQFSPGILMKKICHCLL